MSEMKNDSIFPCRFCGCDILMSPYVGCEKCKGSYDARWYDDLVAAQTSLESLTSERDEARKERDAAFKKRDEMKLAVEATGGHHNLLLKERDACRTQVATLTQQRDDQQKAFETVLRSVRQSANDHQRNSSQKDVEIVALKQQLAGSVYSSQPPVCTHCGRAEDKHMGESYRRQAHRGKAMMNEAIRIAIAESMGWRLDKSEDYDAFYSPSGHFVGGATHDLSRAVENAEIPNYPKSLDCCAEFEKTLSANEACLYHGKLQGVVLRDWNAYPDDLLVIVSYSASATALQRCEAYLRVKGLWVEGAKS